MRNTTVGLFLVVGLGVGLVLGGTWRGSDVFAGGSSQRACQEDDAARCAETVAALSDDQLACQSRVEALDDEVADLGFLSAHAAATLGRLMQATPDYDVERFLRENPDARRYFPYLPDAVAKYQSIWPVDPMFALAILKQESDFGRFVVSRAGALGDAQLIASTAARYGLRANEPWTWQDGRRRFEQAARKRREARELSDRFLRDGRASARTGDAPMRERMARAATRYAESLVIYDALLADADRLEAQGEEALAIYTDEIERALAEARALERRVRARQAREDELIEISGLRGAKSQEEKDVEVALIVNDYLAQVDPRLSPLLFVDAMVHHLADLFREFHGDERLVASRYNASRRAMEQAVASVGGGVGIPRIAETQDYVNRVIALRAFFAIDAGVLDTSLGVSCCTRLANR